MMADQLLWDGWDEDEDRQFMTSITGTVKITEALNLLNEAMGAVVVTVRDKDGKTIIMTPWEAD